MLKTPRELSEAVTPAVKSWRRSRASMRRVRARNLRREFTKDLLCRRDLPDNRRQFAPANRAVERRGETRRGLFEGALRFGAGSPRRQARGKPIGAISLYCEH